ncbi:MAG: F0F1 ATP synthase subunit A [Candidatus Moraniibacteriota bacterium]
MNISIAAEPLWWIGSFPVTNAFSVTLIVSVIIVVTSLVLRMRTFQIVPTGLQNALEAFVENFRNLVQSVTENQQLTTRLFPIITTFFLFILLSNWSGLLPGFGTIGIREHGEIIPFGRAATADLNTTIALSLISVFAVQFIGISVLGLRGYAKKFFVSPLHKPYVIGTIVGLFELMGEMTKLISFSFRLFGNIFAGEVLLIVISNLVPYIFPLPFLALEVFAGLVQAGVFAILTLVFLKMATLPAAH